MCVIWNKKLLHGTKVTQATRLINLLQKVKFLISLLQGKDLGYCFIDCVYIRKDSFFPMTLNLLSQKLCFILIRFFSMYSTYPWSFNVFKPGLLFGAQWFISLNWRHKLYWNYEFIFENRLLSLILSSNYFVILHLQGSLCSINRWAISSCCDEFVGSDKAVRDFILAFSLLIVFKNCWPLTMICILPKSCIWYNCDKSFIFSLLLHNCDLSFHWIFSY